jgi:hypothetical protein
LVTRKVAELPAPAGLIDAFRSIEARSLARVLSRAMRNSTRNGCAYFESFNVIISYLYDPDDIFKTNIGRASKAQFIQGQHRPNETEDVHATTVFLKPLERFAIYNADPIPKLSFPKALTGNWLAAHPGSGEREKELADGKVELAFDPRPR